MKIRYMNEEPQNRRGRRGLGVEDEKSDRG